MSIDSSIGRRGRRRFGDKQVDTSPERPRLGGDEHPNIERAGARPHPALAARADGPRGDGRRIGSERPSFAQ